MKYSQVTGIIAAIVLTGSCFVNWAWYPDIHDYFTAFYSMDNVYGKPGKALIFFALIATIFFLVPRVWAKRGNMFLCGINLAYAIKTFILFSSCYRGICPEKQVGIWIMAVSALIMMIAALLPRLEMEKKEVSS